MVDLVLFFILVIGFFIGLRRGFIMQVIHLVSFFISIFIAYKFYEDLAPKLTLWIPYPKLSDNAVMSLLLDNPSTEQVYYRAVAFVILFFLAKIGLHIIGSMLDFLTNLPILRQFNRGAGAVLGFLEVYVLLFIVLSIGALLPIDSIQTSLNNSFLATIIVKHTPFLSSWVHGLWFQYGIGK